MLHEEHDPLCVFQGSYLGSNIQCLNKTRMRLLLQAWATVTAYFSRVGWTVQVQRLALVDPIRQVSLQHTILHQLCQGKLRQSQTKVI